MDNLNKYLNLIKQNIIHKLGQRCIEDGRKGYFCTLLISDHIIPAKVFIGEEFTEVFSTNGKIHYYFENLKDSTENESQNTPQEKTI